MTEAPNAKEQDYWSGPSGRSWIAHQEEQDALLEPVTRLVVERSGIGPGGTAIDIGAGTGALTLAMAKAAGPEGRVIAADFSEPLLAVTKARAEGLVQVATCLCDAQTADWAEPGLDVAVSRFGVMFFADPGAAFANIARALRPGGRFVFAAWGPYEENPWWVIPQRFAAARLGRPPAIPPHTPGPFGLSDLDWALDRIREGGLTDVAGEAVTIDLRHPGGPEAAAELATRIGPAARVVRLFDGTEADRLAIRDGIAAAFAAQSGAGGFAIPAVLHLLTATRT